MNITRVNAVAKPGIKVGGQVVILGLRHHGPLLVTGISGPWVEVESPVSKRRGEMHTDELEAV